MNWVKIRWFLAAVCLLLSIKLMVSAFLIESLSAAPLVVVSVFSFLAAVFLTAKETALRAADWVGQKWANIFFPSEEFSRPPLSYKLARHYRMVRRFEDALAQYRKIIRYYPEETDAYLELLAIAEELGDQDLVAEYESKFRKQFGVMPSACDASIS